MLSEFELLARETRARSGVQLTPEMNTLALQRLAPLARRRGHHSIDDLLSEARAQGDDDLWDAIVESFAHAETRFFRDKAMFERLRRDILPDMLARRAGRVRIWSAGCASGQEAYSLAMMLEEMRAEGVVAAEIVATDMSERLLDKARSGLYTQFEVQRGLPIRKLVQYFEKVGDLWRIADSLRACVRFERHNLLHDASALGTFDIVLCRHVLTSFDPGMRAATLERIADAMRDDGVLLLGASENAPETAAFANFSNGVCTRNAAWAKAA